MRGRLAAFAIGRAAGQQRAQETMAQPTVTQTSTQTDELQRLSDMHSSGALTDEEFTKAKKKLLSGK